MAHCMHHEEVFRTVTSQRHRTSRRKQCVMDSDANQRRNDGLRTVHSDNGVEEDMAVFVAIEEVFCTKDTTTTDDTNHIRRRLSLSNSNGNGTEPFSNHECQEQRGDLEHTVHSNLFN
eukprot:212471_1